MFRLSPRVPDWPTPLRLLPELGPPACSRSPWLRRTSTSGTSHRMVGPVSGCVVSALRWAIDVLVGQDVRKSLELERQEGLRHPMMRHAKHDARHTPELPSVPHDLDGNAQWLEDLHDLGNCPVLPFQPHHHERSDVPPLQFICPLPL